MTTRQGDTWDVLAIRAYGSAEYMNALIAANPAHRMTVVFSAGVEIVVPAIDTTQAAANLPPWRRVVNHG